MAPLADAEPLADAARSAVAIVRALRKGDAQAVLDITATLSAQECAALCGALAALATSALVTVDAMVAYARDAGCGELAGHSSDDVLAKLALSLAN